jgi:ribosome-binding protein aMBF1 (putative translation factor)
MQDTPPDEQPYWLRRPQKRTFPSTPEERDFYGELIARLVAVRKEAGISQAALDDRIGISEGCTAKWESRARIPGAFFLMCWCKALDVQLTLDERN